MSENQDPRPDAVPATPTEPAAQASPPPVPPLPPYPAGYPQQPAGQNPTGGYPAGGYPTGAYPTRQYPGAGFGVPAPSVPPTPRRAAGARRRPATGRIVGLLVAAALVGGAAGLGGTWAGVNMWAPASATSAAGPQTVTVNNTESVNATTAIAAKVVPSVVTVNVSSGQEGGTGSGVVLNSNGDILTNTHVVTIDGEVANPTITVTTSDGHIYPATVVGTDPIYDLAVIHITASADLTPISWGDSGKLNVGDATVAVGAPLGLSNSVTTGIVSALNRSISIASSAAPQGGQSDQGGEGGQNSPFFFDFGEGGQGGQGGQTQQQTQPNIDIAVIQTDAPINPGNSGGALVDSSGKLVGINVAIASTGQSSDTGAQSGSIGVGFSIPSDIAHRIADEIMQNGKATHGLLGASVRDAADVQGATITGAYVVSVTAGGGAAKAGLKAGDIVTAFDGVPVGGAVDLTAQVRAAAAGSNGTVTYVRDGRTVTADVTLGTLE